MNSYYQNLLGEIVRLFAENDPEKANRLIQNELDLPYVPKDALEALEKVRDESAAERKAPGASRDDIEQWINGTPAQKERAAASLQSMNLREYHAEVQKLLLDPALIQEFKGELIEALMQQKIDEPYTMVRDGMEISFVPSLLTEKKNDPVYRQAKKDLEDWFYADNPSFCHFCLQLLDQEVLETRPFDFEGTDPAALAASIARLVFHSLRDEEGWERFVRRQPENGIQTYPLYIEKRGE